MAVFILRMAHNDYDDDDDTQRALILLDMMVGHGYTPTLGHNNFCIFLYAQTSATSILYQVPAHHFQHGIPVSVWHHTRSCS